MVKLSRFSLDNKTRTGICRSGKLNLETLALIPPMVAVLITEPIGHDSNLLIVANIQIISNDSAMHTWTPLVCQTIVCHDQNSVKIAAIHPDLS
ncbi:hypothetical protein Xmir_02570 [Xenorhabdus miraniensis]|uniref:Uncharacterized protein n=1 Tax=Xenorhabdus miraniensis TaxID=351674 RepID=A0A2D0JPH7_9GAMM|nr:hypothetical protein Xmir_02570 [Xenorhabdus miraniensis]